MRKHITAVALAAGLALGGCSSMSQFTQGAAKVEPKLAAACQDAMLVANIAGLVPGVGAVVPYITAGCATADGLAKLAADPNSVQWVGELIGKIKTLAAGAGLHL